jgi:hypothetical protein
MALQIVYKGTDLTAIHADPKQPQKYARKVLHHLFSNEELSTGIYQRLAIRPDMSLIWPVYKFQKVRNIR